MTVYSLSKLGIIQIREHVKPVYLGLDGFLNLKTPYGAVVSETDIVLLPNQESLYRFFY